MWSGLLPQITKHNACVCVKMLVLCDNSVMDTGMLLLQFYGPLIAHFHLRIID